MRKILVASLALPSAQRSTRRALAVLIASILVITMPSQLVAQMVVHHAPGRLHTNQSAKIYLGYNGPEKFDGAYLALPITWSLLDVELLSDSGALQEISFKQSEQYENRFYVFADNGFEDQDQIVLEFDTGYLTSTGMIRMVPFQMDRRRFEPTPKMFENDAVSDRFNVYDPVLLSRNRVLELVDDQPGVVLPSNNFPDFSSNAAFTAELWLKTASSDAIVLSTWDGNESTPYPIELTIDESGHMVFFNGIEGEHHTMRSEIPIADGTWHHIAVTHEAGAGLTRLLIDGEPSDSLVGVRLPSVPQPAFLSI
jgi:hypothetical protein